MTSRTKVAILGATLIAGAGVYLAFAARRPAAEVEARVGGATDRRATRERWRRTENDPKLARGLEPNALAQFRGAWDATKDSTAREQLLVEAARLGVPGAPRWLAEVATSDEKMGTRAGAALGTITDRRAADELSRLAVAIDGPVIVRANAVRALGAAGGAEHVPMLSELVTNPSEPLRVRQEAALSMGRIRSPAAVQDLANALDTARADVSADGEQLRISLIQSLESLGTSEARAALERYARSDPSPTETAFLERALGRTAP